jgi:MFS family permease
MHPTLTNLHAIPDPASLLQRASAGVAGLTDMTMAAHTIAWGTLIAGLLLWLFGHKLIKPMFALAGLIGGALTIGTLIHPMLPEAVFGAPSAWAALAIGGIFGLLAGFVLYRFAMAFAGGIVFASVGLLGAAAYVHHASGSLPSLIDSFTAPATPSESDTPAPSSPAAYERQAALWLAAWQADKAAPTSGEGVSKVLSSPEAQKAADALAEFSATARERATAIATDLKAKFDALAPRDQLIIAGGGILGGLIGLLAGLVKPKKTAAILSALLGSAIALVSLTWTSREYDLPIESYLQHTPMRWLGIWLITAGVGLAIQLMMMKKLPPPPVASGEKPAQDRPI